MFRRLGLSSGRRREYAVVVILIPEAAESESEDTIERILRFIPDLGGNVSRRENLGIQPLYYAVHHFDNARCLVFRFTLDAIASVELKQELGSDPHVLRHVLHNLSRLKTMSPESMLANQPYRDLLIEFLESENAANRSAAR